MIKTRKLKQPRILQGGIYKDIDYLESIKEKSGIITIKTITFPLVIVLSQDCDLEQDFKSRKSKKSKDSQSTDDKQLFSVLVAPLYNAEHVYLGKHLSELDLEMEPINKIKSPGDNLRKNKMLRYHYLEFPPDVPVVPSIIDFKHYFTVNVEYLKSIKSKNFICSVSPLFREDISLRFANYLSRIGLPDIVVH